jgi:hypothetical protein
MLVANCLLSLVSSLVQRVKRYVQSAAMISRRNLSDPLPELALGLNPFPALLARCRRQDTAVASQIELKNRITGWDCGIAFIASHLLSVD